MISLDNLDEVVPVKCNTGDAEVFGNVAYAESLPYPRLGMSDPHEGVAVIVGGGPSMRPLLPMIAAHARAGHAIFALNGATKFLKKIDLIPDHFVLVDSREHNWAFVDEARHYLIASQCHPMVFKSLTGKDVTIWNPNFPGILDHIKYQGALIGGGTTVGLMAPHIAYTMGYRTIHVYGMDSSVGTTGEIHAYPQAQNNKDERIKVRVAGVEYETTPWMLRQAVEFQAAVKQLVDDGTIIHIHGTGLLPAIAKEMRDPTFTVLTSFTPSAVFTEEYVHRLKDAVHKHLTIPHHFVCLTDHPINNIDCVPLELGLPGYWAKPEMYRPDLPFGRVLFIDLSTVITGSLDEMAALEGVVVTRDFYHGTPSPSLILYTVGDFKGLWEAFKADPVKYIKIGNAFVAPDFYDQALMNHCPMPAYRFWQDALPGQLVSYKVDGVPDGSRVVKFHGMPKPHELNWLEAPSPLRAYSL